jgi:hypothetical protein
MEVMLWILLLAPLAIAAQPTIGVIDFHGLRKVPAEAVRKALAVKEGDPLPRSKSDTEAAIELVPGIVRARLEAACCEDGKAILYVGVEEKGAPTFDYRPPPDGDARLPEPIHDAYVLFLNAVREVARTGDTGEDLSQGHSLMHNPSCREAQMRFLPLAKQHQTLLREVLRNSADEEHRAIAAYVIGYAPRKRDVVDDLQYALQDPDDTVRNNAIRSLAAIAVLSLKDPSAEVRVSPTWLIEMLNSLVWSDRHTAAVTLVTMSEGRDPKVIEPMRERALDALVEMAQWKHLPHAFSPFVLLGRVAGLPEKEIQDSWERLDRDAVVRRARDSAKPARKRKE